MSQPTSPLAAGPAVQLFILSRDRKDFCREAVASAVAQDYARCEVIVSDNSVGEEVAEMIRRDFPKATLVQRRPNLPALDHFNQLIEEAQAPFMVLFHDDDVLEPDYVSRMVQHFADHTAVAAVGCNAHLIHGKTITRERLMGDFKGTRLLWKKSELVEPYMSLSLVDPAPFPGYMYRTQQVKGLKLDAQKGGKHSDVSFLCHLLERAPILWTDECLFNYRVHSSNDSRDESVAHRLSWLRHIQTTTGLHRRSQAVKDYKFLYWRRWLQQNSSGVRWFNPFATSPSHRHSVARRFVLSEGLHSALTRPDFWKRTARQLIRAHL